MDVITPNTLSIVDVTKDGGILELWPQYKEIAL